jgi:hypothetical protein
MVNLNIIPGWPGNPRLVLGRIMNILFERDYAQLDLNKEKYKKAVSD